MVVTLLDSLYVKPVYHTEGHYTQPHTQDSHTHTHAIKVTEWNCSTSRPQRSNYSLPRVNPASMWQSRQVTILLSGRLLWQSCCLASRGLRDNSAVKKVRWTLFTRRHHGSFTHCCVHNREAGMTVLFRFGQVWIWIGCLTTDKSFCLEINIIPGK